MDIKLFLMLVAGHYLADFALQPRFMAETKQLVFVEAIGFHALTAHAFIHALTAGVISGSFAAAVIIGATHWLIDLRASKLLRGKREALFGINIDQSLHLLVILVVALAVV
jgi:hypothetical protein